jgi:hypothetical protein
MLAEAHFELHGQQLLVLVPLQGVSSDPVFREKILQKSPEKTLEPDLREFSSETNETVSQIILRREFSLVNGTHVSDSIILDNNLKMLNSGMKNLES